MISIIALILSIMAYTSAGREEDLRARIKDLQAKMEIMKQESSKQLDKLRGETASALEKLSNAVRKKEQGDEKGKE